MPCHDGWFSLHNLQIAVADGLPEQKLAILACQKAGHVTQIDSFQDLLQQLANLRPVLESVSLARQNDARFLLTNCPAQDAGRELFAGRVLSLRRAKKHRDGGC